ncbi:signal peptidase I [Comamonadaceae bacterium M7527]|nr:signal peptidase I [Comamonadaceae bacterium M7527]
MSIVTAVLLGVFVVFAVMWYTGAVLGNFALVLFLATFVTGVYWVAERLYFLPQRRLAAQRLIDNMALRRTQLAAQGITDVDTDWDSLEASDSLLRQPWWLDWTAGLFPVLLVVFVLRSFLFEPFKIPSGSMVPTLRIGDLILVNKFHYGIRLPVLNTKVMDNNEPQRGDVMVFRYPPQPNLDYIKRVVGLPGDEVSYLNKQLRINGELVAQQPLPDFFDSDSMRYSMQFETQLGGKTFRFLNDENRPAFVPGAADFAGRENCNYSAQGVVCKVPAGHYFMMGDNRDNSLDSRYWGFVPEANIVGRAFFVWMNFSDLGRIGGFE